MTLRYSHKTQFTNYCWRSSQHRYEGSCWTYQKILIVLSLLNKASRVHKWLSAQVPKYLECQSAQVPIESPSVSRARVPKCPECPSAQVLFECPSASMPSVSKYPLSSFSVLFEEKRSATLMEMDFLIYS